LRRIRISLPVRVRGINSDGIQFEEITRSVDVNANGALFSLKQELKKGTRLTLSLPLPRSMQKTVASKLVYQTQAVVVRIQAVSSSGERRVAVRFRNESSKAYFQEACRSERSNAMQPKKISLGEMWKSETSGEVFIVTAFCREVLSSYACLRSIGSQAETLRKVKLLRTDLGETLVGFRIAEMV
jgi:hypothetical protein